MRFHEKLAQFADRRGLSQRDVARLASDLLKAQGRDPIPPTSMNRIYNGSTPDLYQAAAIAAVLALPLAYLADDAQSAPPESPDGNPELKQLIKNAGIIGYEEANRRLLNYGMKPITEFRDPHRPKQS